MTPIFSKGDFDRALKACMLTHGPNIDKRLGHLVSVKCIEDLFEAGVITKEAYAKNLVALLNAGKIVNIETDELTEQGKKIFER